MTRQVQLSYVRTTGGLAAGDFDFDFSLGRDARLIELLPSGWIRVEHMNGTLPALYPPSRIAFAIEAAAT